MQKMNHDHILPRSALYICDKNCGPTCDGCFKQKDGVNWTTSELHAKNGPVVNVREWGERFEVQEVKGELFHVEKNKTQN